MATSAVPQVDVQRATDIWTAYSRDHDLSREQGQTAGIEPISGRIWFGSSAADVHHKKLADGVDRPLFFVRVGYDHYLRKGSRR